MQLLAVLVGDDWTRGSSGVGGNLKQSRVSNLHLWNPRKATKGCESEHLQRRRHHICILQLSFR